MLVGGPVVLTGVPTQRGMKKHIKAALVESVGFWHRRFIRRHFTMAAFGLYGYKKRSIEHQRDKLHEKGHKLPIVWSGATRTLVTSFVRKSGTAKRATGTMFAPWYVNTKARRGIKGPILGDELTAVMPSETVAIASMIGRDLVRRQNRDKTKRRARAS